MNDLLRRIEALEAKSVDKDINILRALERALLTNALSIGDIKIRKDNNGLQIETSRNESGAAITLEYSGTLYLTAGGNNGSGVIIGDNVNVGVPIASDSDSGFLIIPSGDGAPTGTPVSSPAVYYDTTNSKLYVYNGGWKSVTLA